MAQADQTAGPTSPQTAAPNGAAEVLCRALGGRRLDGLGLLVSAVQEVGGQEVGVQAGGRLRLCFGTGTEAEHLAHSLNHSATDAARPTEIRAIAGAAMLLAEGPPRLALAGGGGIDIDPVQAEPGLFAGLRCTLGFRLEETAAQLAEGLRHHARHHGLQAALVVNRLPDAAPEAFAADLRAALGNVALRVVLVQAEIPLGKPGLGPENHLYLAPDAPGKDRMTPPAADPWRSPLGETIVLEAMKWRFLSAARSVLQLDASDLLAPRAPGAPSAFELCEAAPQGVILLVGQRIYPWRVRAGQAPRFGDHICRQFDGRRGIARWGVAPQKAGLDNSWRGSRISAARPDADGVARFLRAMAIRVPGGNSGELAPKTSLIEDAGLLALADTLGHRPIRAPVSKPRNADSGNRTAIVTTMKNEGPFILEWLAWHRAIGVDDFLIYTNDCSDGTDTMLDLLQRKGLVQHRINPYVPGGELKPQHAALQAAEAEPVMQDCGWGICMDVDEFINVKIGDGTLAALYAAMGKANMISLTWRLFGNAEVHGFEDRFITEQFTRCAPELIRKPHQAWGFKTLFRNIELYKKLGVHRPKGLKPDLWQEVRWLNGSGRPMPKEMFRNAWRSTTETYGYDWVQLNHYAVRSAESFLVKRDRGRVNHVDRDQGLNYWFRMNHNVAEDRSALRMLPAARAEYDRLLADPEIRAAHDHSVACHRAKITDLLQTPNYRAFHAELTGARMEKLCRLQHHFGSAVFSAGPQVIPPDLHEQDLPRDFFFTVDHAGEAEH